MIKAFYLKNIIFTIIMNRYTLILFIILIICWTFNPFFRKGGLGALNPKQFWIFNIILCFVFTAIYVIYIFFNTDFNMDSLANITKKQLLCCILSALTSVIAGLIFINLLKDDNVTFIIPQTTPICIILTLIIGYLLFNEEINKSQVIGGFIVIVGLYIFNKDL